MISLECPIPDYTQIPLEILEIPLKLKRLIIVGASPKPDRPSHVVMDYLLKKGFTIIPVNPTAEEILGIKAVKRLSEVPPDYHPEVIIIFRKSSEVLPIVEEAIKLKPKVIWMQEGIANEEAKALAEKEGIQVVMNLCFKKVHALAQRA